MAFVMKLRQFPGHDFVGVGDDETFHGLAENFRQLHRGKQPGSNEIPQHVSRPHRGKLVAVPHQNQPAAKGKSS